jgi:DNA (cytosine-5)-methyltransferase 3A
MSKGRKINVLSLFDGLSGARIALDQLGIECNYYASEVDKYAIKVAQANYPDTIQLGDVTKVHAEDLPPIDLLIGGSPCQDLSVAKVNRKGLEGSRSGLFWEYIRLLRELKPRYFVLENVYSMKSADRDIISKEVGCSPMMINSALVTAQNRKRYYWHNTGVFMQPMDEGIVLADIIEEGAVDRNKSYCIDANFHKGTSLKHYQEKGVRQVVFKTGIYTEPRGFNKGGVRITDKSPTLTSSAFEHNNKLVTLQPIKLGHIGQDKRPYRVYSTEGKSVTLMGEAGGMGAKTGLYYTKEGIRKLTPLECERLQGIPEGYTAHVSNTQRYKMIGNGFTIPVIIHILKGMEF